MTQTLNDGQCWILATSGLLTILWNGDPHYFGGGIPVKHSLWAQEKLKADSIHTLDDLYRNINNSLGYIPKPLVLSKGLTDEGNILIAFKANALYPPDEGDNTWWQSRYSLGWGLMRTSHLASLAYVACIITLEEAWDIACFIAQIYQQIFDSWDDVYTAAKKSLSIGDTAAEYCYTKLMETDGLWTLPWNTEIKNIPPPIVERRTFFIKPHQQSISHKDKNLLLFSEALSQAADGDRFVLSPGIYPGPWQINKSIEIISEQGKVICHAPENASASILITDAFVQLTNIQCISPAGDNRGQVAIACLSGCLRIESSHISSTGHGISIANQAKTILYNCLLDSCALNGVVVEGILEAHRSTLSNIQYHSIHANHQAEVYLTHCLVKNSSSHMLSLENGSSAHISDSDFDTSSQAAFVASANSTLEIIRCKAIKAGLIALHAKRCFILDSTFDSPPEYHQAQQQIAVFSQTDEVVLVNTQFNQAIHHAVHIDQASRVRIENSLFNGVQGCGLIISNGMEAGEISIKNSLFNSQQGEMAVMVNQSQANFINCAIEGGIEASLVATEKSIIDLRSCQFKQSPKVALLVRNHSHCSSNNCQFSKSGLSAVDLMDSFGKFTLCQFMDLATQGIRIHGQSNVTLDQCLFDKVGNQSIQLNGSAIVTANQLRITRSEPEIMLLENGAYFTMDSAEFDESKKITITLKNATLAHRNCDAITKKYIHINNQNGMCLSLN